MIIYISNIQRTQKCSAVMYYVTIAYTIKLGVACIRTVKYSRLAPESK